MKRSFTFWFLAVVVIVSAIAFFAGKASADPIPRKPYCDSIVPVAKTLAGAGLHPIAITKDVHNPVSYVLWMDPEAKNIYIVTTDIDDPATKACVTKLVVGAINAPFITEALQGNDTWSR